MKWTLTFLAFTTVLFSCSSEPCDRRIPDSPSFDRSVWAAETMKSFGYQPNQYEAGEGMATVDDFSAPRVIGGPSGYLIISVDGESVSRRGPSLEIEYVPYAWISEGEHLLEFQLRPETPRDGRPERISLHVEMTERTHYLPKWNGKVLELQVW